MINHYSEIVTPEFLKSLRSKLNLSQKQLSVELGVSLQTVKKWEQGVNPILGTSAILLYILSDDSKIYRKYIKK